MLNFARNQLIIPEKWGSEPCGEYESPTFKAGNRKKTQKDRGLQIRLLNREQNCFFINLLIARDRISLRRCGNAIILYNCSVYYLQFCLRGFFVGIAGGEVVFQFGEVGAVKIIAELMELCHNIYVCQRIFVACQFS